MSMQRRRFLTSSAALAAAASVDSNGLLSTLADHPGGGAEMEFGLVTYMWGSDWDLPTLLKNCQAAGAKGVELRTTHAHGVEPSLSAQERKAVKSRFADSSVKLVGLASNEDFHDVDPQSLAASVETAKAFIKLSHDVGGSGVKVKPNDLPKGVPPEKTIEQIGRSLNQLGRFAAGLGQEVRVEVHGGCAPLPIMAAIMEVADHPSVVICWNSNPQDLKGVGLQNNFRLVQDRLGATVHVRQLDGDEYPYPELFELLRGIDYRGWILIEASDEQADRVSALAAQRLAFERLRAG